MYSWYRYSNQLLSPKIRYPSLRKLVSRGVALIKSHHEDNAATVCHVFFFLCCRRRINWCWISFRGIILFLAVLVMNLIFFQFSNSFSVILIFQSFYDSFRDSLNQNFAAWLQFFHISTNIWLCIKKTDVLLKCYNVLINLGW